MRGGVSRCLLPGGALYVEDATARFKAVLRRNWGRQMTGVPIFARTFSTVNVAAQGVILNSVLPRGCSLRHLNRSRNCTGHSTRLRNLDENLL